MLLVGGKTLGNALGLIEVDSCGDGLCDTNVEAYGESDGVSLGISVETAVAMTIGDRLRIKDGTARADTLGKFD